MADNVQVKLDQIEKTIAAGFAQSAENNQCLRDYIGTKLAVMEGRIIALEGHLEALRELGKLILSELEEPPAAVSGKLVLGPLEPQ